MRVLVVDDEPALRSAVQRALALERYDVALAEDGRQALDRLAAEELDAVVLDVAMPHVDGLEVCRRMRQAGDRTPVLMLTARDAIDDRVAGLDAGADDYLVKPFAFSELLARVQNILRRGPVQRDQVMRVADLEVDPVRRRVTRAGDRIDLTVKEYALLDYFVRHAGEMCSRTLIAENVWDMNFDSDTNVVDVAVRRLRAKLDDPYETKLIHTIRGVGYVFDARGE